MATLQSILLAIHIVGFVALLAGILVQLPKKTRKIKGSMLHGVATQLVTGFGLVYVIGARGEETLNYGLVGFKLLVLVVIFALIFKDREKERVSALTFWGIFALTLLNAGIASGLTA